MILQMLSNEFFAIAMAIASLVQVGTLAQTPNTVSDPHLNDVWNIRKVLPLYLGSLIEVKPLGQKTPGRYCTVGAVLMYNKEKRGKYSWGNELRFVLTAGDCGSSGNGVYLPGSNRMIGEVIAKFEAEYDLLLIIIDPFDLSPAPVCHGGGNLWCTQPTWQFAAAAKSGVFVHNTNDTKSIIGVTDWTRGPPTSLQMSGPGIGVHPDHVWIVAQWKSYLDTISCKTYARTKLLRSERPLTETTHMDIGCPIYNDRGQLEGILSRTVTHRNKDVPDYLLAIYSPIHDFLSDNKDYVMAPPVPWNPPKKSSQ